ncbi:TPA: WD40 repeat domain-containing protein [Candidatus Poribacteria bacterium]|nr:WD40 repeat domain-containing protein [Candidatus Poribacteria bacterium]HIO81942.1 WD40 repeat domain-containing protein [Candidatus Poribacteria bacterium]
MRYIISIIALVVVSVSWGSRPKQISNSPYHALAFPGAIEKIACSPDNRLVAIASQNGLYLYDTFTRAEPSLLISGHTMSVAFNPEGTILASGRRDKKVHLWKMATDEHVELKGHMDAVLSVCFSPDGQILASGSDIDDGTVRLWDVAQEKEIGRLPLETDVAYSLAFRPDGQMLAVGEYNITSLWNPHTQDILTMFIRRQGFGPELWIRCLAFSPDGAVLAVGSSDNVVNLWNLSDIAVAQHVGQLRNSGDVEFVDFTPDGDQLAYGGWGRIIAVYDTVGRETVYWESGTRWIRSGVLSSDGKRLITASKEGDIQFWQMPKRATNVATRLQDRITIQWSLIKTGSNAR